MTATPTFDVAVVGAGPAGSAAACLLARAGLRVVLFERGTYPGAKNVFGGVLATRGIADVFPEIPSQAPLERRITRRTLSLLSEGSALALAHQSARLAEDPAAYTVLRTKFDPWFAQLAVAAGARLVTETLVDDLLWEGTRVAGVRVGREQGDLRAKVVVAADGVNSLLAKRAGLRRDFAATELSLGVKDLVALPRKVIEERFGISGDEGASYEFLGGLPPDIIGGGYLYTNRDSLSVGVVVQVSSLAGAGKRIEAVLDDFKRHPAVAGLLRDGSVREYGAHLIPEAGVQMLPKLCGDGILLAGDAAALVLATGLHLEGANLAIASGIAAAAAIKLAFDKGDFSAATLGHYADLLEHGPVLGNLRRFRRAPELLRQQRLHERYPKLLNALATEALAAGGTHEKLLPLLVRALRKEVGWRAAAGDLLRAGRGLLW